MSLRSARIIALACALFWLAGAPLAQAWAAADAPISPDAINESRLTDLLQSFEAPLPVAIEAADGQTGSKHPDPAIVRLQVLLDRSGTSPGVIDGFDGDNVRKGVIAFQMIHGLEANGQLTPEFLQQLERDEPIVGTYEITREDVDAIVPPLPTDYAELAQRDYLGYTSVPELLAERFHMDIDLLEALNPGASFTVGERVFVTPPGTPIEGKVARIEADKSMRQLRAYDAEGNLVVAYPATIGSQDNPSPSGVHEVLAVAPEPTYTYNPKINFKQGDNDEVLTLPPGPNGPVGSVWIDLSEPTYGIHGTPEPSLIDKTASHGCVRLTNWDAEELSKMVAKGVTVEFIS